MNKENYKFLQKRLFKNASNSLLLMIVIGAFLLPSKSIANTISANQGIEICDNRIDDDGDGLIDCLDPDCSGDISCWDCLDDFYQVHSNSTIVRLNPSNGSYQTVGTISGASAINGAAMNHLDGHVYAPCIINGNHTLGMLMNDGVVIDLGLSLPGNILYVGGISTDGKLYANRGSSPIYMIDLAQQTLSYVATGTSNPGVADFSVDYNSGLFYGIDNTNKLKVFDPFADHLSTYVLAGSITNETGAFGATWSSNDGSFFAYNNNSGKIFTVDVNTLTATEVLNAVGNLSINDGFNCLTASPPFETYCNNGIDDDGDGVIDCNDGDCYESNYCTYEICDNGIDDDNDGWTDCSDTECFDLNYCIEICDNGIDDNGNGLIDSNDPQCNTPSGVVGGLESNGSIADKIARRHIIRALSDDKEFEFKMEGLIPFVTRGLKGQFDLSEFIAQDVNDAYVSESSPNDLINITNASDVVAADYYIDDQRIGAILAIQSTEIYEHAKYICDRLEGSRLLDVSHLFSRGGLYQCYELLNTQQDVEYAVNFSMYHDDELGFVVENHWNLSQYPEGKDYYNFQIWASDYSRLISILDATLGQIELKDQISSVNSSELPRLFATYGAYSNGNLRLHLRNKDGLDHCTFSASVRRTETSGWEDMLIDIPLTGNQAEILDIPVGYLYDLGGSIQNPSVVSDEIFLADGRWTVSDDHSGATVISQQIGEQITEFDDNVYQVERSITVQAEISNYLNIYRSLNPKFKPVDLSVYNSLTFDAIGEGLVEVSLVKESLEEGELNPRVTIRLDGQAETFKFDKSDFSNDTDWSDITMLVFTLISDGGSTQLFEVTLSDVTFGSATLSKIKETQLKLTKSSILPNPVSTSASLYIDGLNQINGCMRIFNPLGKEVMKQLLNITQESQKVELGLEHLASGYYYYTITQNGKLLTSGSFNKAN